MAMVVGVTMRWPKNQTYKDACVIVGKWLNEQKLVARLWNWDGSIGIEFSKPVDRDQLRHSAPWMPMPWGAANVGTYGT